MDGKKDRVVDGPEAVDGSPLREMMMMMIAEIHRRLMEGQEKRGTRG